MQNKTAVALPFIIFMAFAPVKTPAQGFDNALLFGGGLDYNVRKGALDFGGGHLEDLPKPAMVSGGLMFGRRWSLLPDLRLQLAANIKYGSAVDDTLPPILLTDGSSVPTVISTTFLYGGCVADFQLPITIDPGAIWYLHGGGGGHIVDISESERTTENPPRIISGDPYPVSELAFSASVDGGIGFELVLSPRYSFAFEYSLRYWYPVHYGMSRDLFPYNPIRYHEEFFSHELSIMLLAKQH